MIYTVTLNPSLDYIVAVKQFRTGIVNRTSEEKLLPGGKGINVSIVLKNLGVESIALGFAAGFTGAELERRLAEFGICTDFVRAGAGMTRINVKLRSEAETEINGMGPRLAEEELESFFKKLDRLSDGDCLVLAGNIPTGLPVSFYRRILEHVSGKKLQVVVDATKESLLNTLPFHPFLIKPNRQELQELFGVEISSQEELSLYAGKLQEMGARNVLVSLAGEGAFLKTETGEMFFCDAPKGTVINSVGAGDSMVAGFLKGFWESGDYGRALQMGICAGSASAFSQDLALRRDVEELFRSLQSN